MFTVPQPRLLTCAFRRSCCVLHVDLHFEQLCLVSWTCVNKQDMHTSKHAHVASFSVFLFGLWYLVAWSGVPDPSFP